jgi:AraC-like DNA-binding protein
MPQGSPVLALLGKDRFQTFGKIADSLHFHNYMEIGYCYGGCGEMAFESGSTPYAGDFFTMIPKNRPHNTIAAEKNQWEYLFVDVSALFHAQFKDEPLKEKWLTDSLNINSFVLSADENAEMAVLIRDIMDLHRKKPNLYIDCACACLLALLIRATNLPKSRVADSAALVACNNKEINRAIEYIWRHFKEEIDCGQIAKACNMSETNFRRRFVELMRLPPMAYLNLTRIEEACKYLRTTDELMQDIALKCGFPTIQSFNRNFKKLLGTTPTRWRSDTVFYEQQLQSRSVKVFNGWL